jgi:hypothetical protein
MKFLRNLSAVVFTVAAIIGLGLLWAHAYGGGTGTGPGGAAGHGAGTGPGNGRIPPRVPLMRLGHGKAAGLIQAHSSGGFQIAGASNLIRTILIEAALAAVVIAVSVTWRRYRRQQRMAASA